MWNMLASTGKLMEKEHERDQSGSYQYYFWYESDEYCIDTTSESAKLGRPGVAQTANRFIYEMYILALSQFITRPSCVDKSGKL